MSTHTAPTTVLTPKSPWVGPFYFNRDDRRLFVPKRHGAAFGYTFNFARPLAYAILLALLVAPLGLLFVFR